MKESFIKRVIREEIVDTRKYRYVYFAGMTCKKVVRMARINLDTTWALDSDNWEVVKEWV